MVIPTMNWCEENLGESLMLFKQKIQLYIEDQDIKNQAAQARKIIIGLGDEGLRRLNASDFDNDQKKVPENIWKFLEAQLQKHINFRINRLLLMQLRQKNHESLDDFILRARTLGHKCQFSNAELEERLIECIIASTQHDLFRNWLYDQKAGVKLQKVLEEGRRYEARTATNSELAQMSKMSSATTNIDAIRRTNQSECPNCDREHPPRRCPAYYSECNKCGKFGHWDKCCRTRNNRNQEAYCYEERKAKTWRIDTVQEADDSEEDSEEEYTSKEFASINITKRKAKKASKTKPKANNTKEERTEIHTTLHTKASGKKEESTLKVKIDTGAPGNTLPLKTFQQMHGSSKKSLRKIRPIHNVKLTAYGGHAIPCLGTVTIPCRTNNSTWRETTFYVVDVQGPAILGLPTSEELQLITIHV